MQTKLCVKELFSQLSSALTTGTRELLNWKLLYGIAGYMYFLLSGCANKLLCVSVCVCMCVYISGFLVKLTLTNCSCVFRVTTVVVPPSTAGTQIQKTLQANTLNIIQPYHSSTLTKFCPHCGSSSPGIAQLMTHNL